MKNVMILLICSTLSIPALAKINQSARPKLNYSVVPPVFKTIKDPKILKETLTNYFKRKLSKKQIAHLKKEIFLLGGKAVPSLIQVMKNSKYPDTNKWVATFMVGKIMGKKSGPFISKFLKHPSWVMRMASLKTLLALGEVRFGGQYARALKDKSMIVRTQALENISRLKLKKYSANVWAMLYDKKNYYSGKKSKSKRTSIVKRAIKVVGDLKFEKALKPLLQMSQKKKYKDVFPEIDYSLVMITGKKSPKDNALLKRNFWKNVGISHQTF